MPTLPSFLLYPTTHTITIPFLVPTFGFLDIHIFHCDGNEGKVGALYVLLLVVEKGNISGHFFYISLSFSVDREDRTREDALCTFRQERRRKDFERLATTGSNPFLQLPPGQPWPRLSVVF